MRHVYLRIFLPVLYIFFPSIIQKHAFPVRPHVKFFSRQVCWRIVLVSLILSVIVDVGSRLGQRLKLRE